MLMQQGKEWRSCCTSFPRPMLDLGLGLGLGLGLVLANVSKILGQKHLCNFWTNIRWQKEDQHTIYI